MNLLNRTSIINFERIDILWNSIRNRVKSICRLHFLGSSVFKIENLDILWDSIEHTSKKLLPFEFAWSFRF